MIFGVRDLPVLVIRLLKEQRKFNPCLKIDSDDGNNNLQIQLSFNPPDDTLWSDCIFSHIKYKLKRCIIPGIFHQC